MSIFILPPSRRALAERLASRATDSAQVIARRLRDAAADMAHYREFDYVVVNDDFAHAVAELRRIIAGDARTWRARRPQLGAAARRSLLAPQRLIKGKRRSMLHEDTLIATLAVSLAFAFAVRPAGRAPAHAAAGRLPASPASP